jgi:spermidine synthase
MLLLFSMALLWSAALLFSAEPMVAKMLLPRFGGAPLVWVTCMLFFQVVLLAGYAYAHLATLKLGARRHAPFHVLLGLLPLFVLPIGFSDQATMAWPAGSNPAPRLLGLLAARVALPFFVLSATGPLLQKWFASAAHPSAKDPYFLYAASNLGSMLALLAYPVLIEPRLGLAGQSRLWQAGYRGLWGVVAACALIVRFARVPTRVDTRAETQVGTIEEADVEVRAGRRLLWIFLSFVPSSLLLGVTTYVTTDIAAVPLFWVVPLLLYLLSFVLVFTRGSERRHRIAARALPFVVSGTALVMWSELAEPGWLVVVAHLGMFFVAAVVCHGAVAKLRPGTRHLTEFYLCMAVGGALGGLFNALVAPAVFDRLLEYPLIIVVACLCRTESWKGQSPDPRRGDLFVPLAVGGLAAALVLVVRRTGLPPGGQSAALMFGPPLLLNYSTLHRPVRFGLGIGAIFLASALYAGALGRVIHRERDFFGVVRVSVDPEGRFRQIVQGTTVHGRQRLEGDRRDEPTGYYHRHGPLGQIFGLYEQGPNLPRVGIIGLGAGVTAGYAQPGQQWTFYELDPVVVSVARDPRYFTYLSDKLHGPGQLRVVLGDARLRLCDDEDRSYGLLVLDAFSSDAIPVHLVTREAFLLYAAKLADAGLLALHVSNHYIDLLPVVADLARDAHLVAFARRDHVVSVSDAADGMTASEWIVLAKDKAVLAPLADDARWAELLGRPARRVWTDDYSNLLGVYKW